MIPAKETKEMLYTMFGHNFVHLTVSATLMMKPILAHILCVMWRSLCLTCFLCSALQEIPKTPDHAPARTFYLFSVDLNQIARMLIVHCHKVCR